MEQSDAQLARAAMAGDRGAFGVLVERLRAALIGYAVGLTGNREDAEEVAQEALLEVWRCLPSLRDPERVRAWSYRLTHNLSMKRRRNTTCSLTEHMPDRARPAEDEQLLALAAAIARLSEPHREVIHARYSGGATTAEVAQQLGIPAGTVRSRLTRAYAELRELLSREKSL